MESFFKGSIYRGGTSKALLLNKEDLSNYQLNHIDDIVISIMGSPHKRQIDGIGNGDSLCSKVAIVSKSLDEGVDLEYFFMQVGVNDRFVDKTVNCGNIASSIAPFAVNSKIINIEDDLSSATLKVKNINTNVIFETKICVKNGSYLPDGDMSIDGVNNTYSPIELNFFNPVGAKTGKLLPTGNVVDNIDGIDVSCIDVAVPMIIIDSTKFDKTGKEPKDLLDEDKELLRKIEKIRKKASYLMGLGDCSNKVIPKVCLISKPASKANSICSRYFTPFDCHSTHSVSGAMCLASSLFIEGSIACQVINNRIENDTGIINIEHPSGIIPISYQVDNNQDVRKINIIKMGFFRTARELVRGIFFYKL
ncbi:prpF family protein [Francisella tularensis subsp. novicida D9876]|uniref:PrpF domain-containing protein n=1 Tax=Francisella tularensis TaxID=263 RepID=UPI0005A56856|nr:PrpF domain-containing protein [Francisella tularensis]AJI73476.1 prpF family protein [Francisella tularensis subsp. novicida D9876]